MKKHWHLIVYDISCPRRLRKVHRYLTGCGIAVQYSVFLIHIDKVGLNGVMSGLDDIIDARHDDVRAYPCRSAGHIWLAGRDTDFWRIPDSQQPKTAVKKEKKKPEKTVQPAPKGKSNQRWFWQF